MAATYAGHWVQAILDSATGELLTPGTTARLRVRGTTTAVTTYSDRTKASTAALSVDNSRNLHIYAEPGDYDLNVAGDTIAITINEDKLDTISPDQVGTANGVASLDGTGKILLSAIPEIPRTKLDQSTRDSLAKADSPTQGIPDGSVTNVSIAASANIDRSKLDAATRASLNKADAAMTSAPVTSVNGQTGDITVVNADVVGDATATTKGLVAISGDLSGTADNITVPGLEGKADRSELTTGLGQKVNTNDSRLSNARPPTDGSVANSSVAANADIDQSKIKDLPSTLSSKVGTTDSRLSNARTPTGAAGGVLAGSYPNPDFATDMATQVELNAAITQIGTKYSKPGSGIPLSDLAQSVQDKINAITGGTTTPVDTSTPTTATYQATVQAEDSLRGYWRLQETSGTSAAGINSLTGTYIGSYTLGATGRDSSTKSVTLANATGAMVQVPQSTLLQMTTGITIELWLNTTTMVEWRSFVSKQSNYSFGAGPAGALFFSGAGGTYTSSAARVVAGQWQHFAATHDNGQLKFYVNGVLTDTITTTNQDLSSSANTLQIGNYNGLDPSWPGSYSDVAIYNEALTATKIKAHYDAASQSTTTPPPASNQTWKIMPLGDSITEGWTVNPGGYRIKLYPNLTTAGVNFDLVGTQSNGPSSLLDKQHEGHSGWRIDQIRANIDSYLSIAPPDLVLLHIGTNDIIQYNSGGSTPDSTLLNAAPARLKDLIIRICTRRPGVQVVVAQIINRPGLSTQVDAYNAAIPQIVTDCVALGYKVRLINMRNVVTTYEPDNTHPTLTGFNAMADAWTPVIQGVVNGTSPTAPVAPYANLPGFTLNRWTTFDTLASEGGGTNGVISKYSFIDPYPASGQTTYGKNNGTGDHYDYDNNMSVVSGVAGATGNCLKMRLYRSSVDGKAVGCAPQIRLLSNSLYQTYGRYEVRMRADGVTGWKTAFLTWPQGSWPLYGELDFPEGSLTGTIEANTHVQGGGSNGEGQQQYKTTQRYTDWHTFTTEWTPSAVRYFIDGVNIGTTTSAIPNGPMRWILQCENNLGGTQPGSPATANVYVDSLAVWSYTP